MFRSSRKKRLNRLPFVWKQMKIQFRMRSLTAFSFTLLFAQPVFFSAVGYFLARAAGRSTPDLIYTIVGSGVMGVWSTVLFTSFFDIRADRREGVLELIIGSPTSLFAILSIRTFTNLLTGTISLMLSLIAVTFIFHFSLPGQNFVIILVSTVILLFSFWCIGVFLVHWQAVSRLSGLFINYLEMPVIILAGFMFPSRLLPDWARWFSGILPMSWAFDGLNVSLRPSVDWESLWTNWLMALGMSGIFLIVTMLMSKRVHDMIRVTGEISSA